MRNELLAALAELKTSSEKEWAQKMAEAIKAGEINGAVIAQEQLFNLEMAFVRLEEAVIEHF